MLEPIAIDINMHQNISDEAPKAAAASDEMTKSLDATQKKIEELNAVIKDMKIAIAEQEKMMANSNETIVGASRKLEVMNLVLASSEKELAMYKSTTEQANKAMQEGADVAGVLADVRESLSNTEGSLIDSAKGLIDTQEEINNSLSDAEKKTYAYSASNQIASEAIKRVAGALGIENPQIVRAISNVHSIEGVKKGWLAITKALTAAQKVLVVTGIMGLIAAIGMAIYYVKSLYDEQRKLKSSFDDVNKVGAKARGEISKQTATYEKLRREWVSLSDSLDEKKKFVKDNADAFNELGLSVNDVSDAENLFVNNTEAVIASLRARAEGAVYAQLAAEKLKEHGDKMDESEKRFYDPDMGDKAMDVLKSAGSQVTGAFDWIKYGNFTGKSPFEIAMEESTKMREDAKQSLDGYNHAIDMQIKKEKEHIDVLQQAGILTKKEADKLKKHKEAEGKLKAWDFKDKKPTNPKISPEEKVSTTLEKKAYDYQKRIDDARVKAIHDGAEKERQATKAEYDQTQAFIEKELKEIEKLENKTGKPATDHRTKLVELDVEATRQYEAEIGRINAQSKATLDGIFTEVNARFASELDNNLLSIKRYYADLIKEAKKADENIDITPFIKAQKKDEDRARVDNKLRKLDLDEALEMEKANNLASIGLTTVAEQAKFEIVKKYLKDRIDLLRKLGDESSNKEADILETRLKGMQSSPKSISGLVNGALFNKIKKGFEKTGDSAEEAQAKTTSLFSNFQKGGAQAVAAINEIKGVFGGLDEGLDKALDALGGIAEGFASGGIAGGAMAIIGQGIKMFTSAAQVEKEHQQALKQLALAKLEMQREYNLLLLKEQLYYKQGSNIFGTNQIRGAANSILTYRDSIVLLKKEMQGEKPNEVMGAAFEKMANSKNGLLASVGKRRLDEYKKEMDAYNKGVGALADVDIVTGSKKSGWGFWKKRKDVYSSLLDTYDDVIDKEGKLNTNRIEAILNTHKMSDENRALLESLLNLSEAAEEAEEQLRSYLTQTFGGLGDALADSIVSAFASGEDAAQLFKGNVTDVLNDIAKQMVFGLYLKDTFDKLEKDIHNAYEDLADDNLTEQQLSEKITNILGGFFGGIGGDIEEANKFLDEFWKNAEANGFDRPEGERQGATGGFANASQDSIDGLTGGVYAVRQIVGDIRQDNREELLVSRTIASQMNILVERSEDWEHLRQLPKVVEKLEAINSYGIKIQPS